MASDHSEHENENEQENTEQIGDLQQIENLKIQVREMMKHSNPAAG